MVRKRRWLVSLTGVNSI